MTLIARFRRLQSSGFELPQNPNMPISIVDYDIRHDMLAPKNRLK
jgi:hypothetical protein